MKKKLRISSRNGHPSAKSDHDADNVGALINAGRFREALDACSRLLLQRPADGRLLHFAGIASERLGDHDAALAFLQAAQRQMPNDPSLYNHLGIVHESLGELLAATEAYQRSIQLAPAFAEAHSNLASLQIKQDKPEDALQHAKIALQARPADPLTWVALGDASEMLGDHAAAVSAYEHAITLAPPSRRAFTSLAMLYLVSGRTDEAIGLLDKARRVFDDDPLILNDLGLAFGRAERFAEAQTLFELAYRQLRETTTLYNIVMNLSKQKRWGDVLALEAEVMSHPQPNTAIPPLFAAAVQCNAFALQERMLPHFLAWCEHDESKLEAASQNAVMLLPVPTVSPLAIRNLLERCADRYAANVHHVRLNFDYQASHDHAGKIRIGYLSSDFRQHVVNYFISGQLSHYDRQYFEVFCYSSLAPEYEDEITDQYRRAVDAFANIDEMRLSDLARRIHADGIDILIDLSGHTAGTRLGVMAYRPAPVQACYLGYPFTTGLKSVDYYLADGFLNGPGNADYFTEELIEISPSYITGGELPVSPTDFEPPVARNGYVTFGTLNNPYKLNRPTIAAWSAILAATPRSRFILNHPGYSVPEARQNVIDEFRANGIGPERIVIVFERHPKGSHLNFYEDLDIALDTFPLTGGTTTYESLWMGVPVVTLVGNASYQRLSYTFLRNSGSDTAELIADTEREFIDKAVALAADPDRIATLHEAIGKSIRRSILCDPARQVRHYEEALIEAWNRKFPDRPEFAPDTFAYTRLESPCAPLVATVSAPGNLHHYVVQEQGQWFAPEYRVLRQLARQVGGGLAVEIGAEPGFFALELAHAGMKTLSLATSAVSARLIRAGAEKGGVAERVETRLDSTKTAFLDRADLHGVTLLRLGVEANDSAGGPVVKNPEFWKRNAPIVLTSVHCGGQSDLSTAAALSDMDYRLYRFMPGLECFVPYALAEVLDPYALYLLACPAKYEADLAANGILVSAAKAVPAEDLARFGDLDQFDEPWQQVDDWIVRCATVAHDAGRDVAERLGYHQAALRAQLTVVQKAPTSTRLITLARLLAETGRRAEAVNWLHRALGEFETGSGRITVPFLAPSATWDLIPAGDRVAEWLFAALLETRCRLAAHSSFFLSDADLAATDHIATLGFTTSFLDGIRRARAARNNFR